MANKKVWLTDKGRKKVGNVYIKTTDERIEYKGPYVVITSTDSGQTYILEKEDINQIN